VVLFAFDLLLALIFVFAADFGLAPALDFLDFFILPYLLDLVILTYSGVAEIQTYKPQIL
jgi:hypothetical protein